MAFVAPIVAGLAAAAPALSAAGAVVGAGGAVLGGIAQSNEANYQAQVARNNASIAKSNAELSLASGETKTQQEGLKEAAEGGAIKAAQAANNTDVNTGSAAQVQTSQRELGALDQQTVANNAELEAYGYKVAAGADEGQASLYQTEAEEAPIGADIGAAGGLLANAGALGFKWNSASGTAGSGGAGFGDPGES